jgi:hypothetical protein
MGREIRRVPQNWEHPKEHKYGRNWRTGQFEETDEYKPLFDRSFEEVAKKWIAELQLWLEGKYEGCEDEAKYPRTIRRFCEYHGQFPDPDYYRPEWDETECTAYQVYETVSEGTPTSPVFQTEQETIDWLVGQGHSLSSATKFVKGGWAPSFVMSVNGDGSTTMASGIDALDL